MVGRVGADDLGHQLRHALAVDGIAIDTIQVDATTHTGIAAIAVAQSGENQIIVVPGANSKVDATELNHLQQQLPTTHLLLLQFEIPLPMVREAAAAAYAAGVTVIVDPAPAQSLPPADSLYRHTHILTPNQVEASQLVGFPVNSLENAAAAAKALRQQGVAIAMVKLGAQGVLCATETAIFHVPAFTVPIMDTVAAGDAFNGGLAVALHDGKSLREAIAWASATAALSVMQAGAQPSLPTRSQVASFLLTH